MRSAICRFILLSFFICCWVDVATAETTQPADPQTTATTNSSTEETTPALPPVTVTGKAIAPLTSKSELDNETLQHLPKKNSSITESITLLPRVQIGEDQRTSENAGEILPPWISISGGRAYENYYAVDGANQSSLLDPLQTNSAAPNITNIPGHPQRGFVHQDLIDSVTVYDSNVPAKYGRFVGGVVDAKTRMPATEVGGNVSIRTTQDSWTQFHIADDDEETFYSGEEQNQQPYFTKYDGGFELDLPVNDQMGFLAAYKQFRSNLEFTQLGDSKPERKSLENYFLKYAWAPDSPYTLELAASHTPSKEEFFIKNTKDSDITIKRGGYSINGLFSGGLPFGQFELTGAYLYNENSRNAHQNHYFWPKDTPSKNWGEINGVAYSAEGGYGDIDTHEKSLQFRAELVAEPLLIGGITNTFTVGVELSHDQAKYDRKETTYEHALNRAVADDTVICGPNDPACIDQEVYFRERRVYASQSEDATIYQDAVYLEDMIGVGSVTFRPGIRISHDDFMHNTDEAYRLAASWDIFRNDQTVLVGGYNRYYGEALLTYKLREAIEPYVLEDRTKNSDNTLSDWEIDGTQTFIANKYSDLDTPYSDEWMIGFVQQLLGSSLEVNYMERKNKDQFAKELVTYDVDGETQRAFILNNNGTSKYKSVKVAWQRQWLEHYLGLNYTYSDSEASNQDDSYDDIFDAEDVDEQVWYDGDVISKSGLPRRNYNPEHAISLIYIGKLPFGFIFTNITEYNSGYETVNSVRLSDQERAAKGVPGDLTVYEKNQQPGYWTFDWRIDWQARIYREQLLTLSLEIDNVFDRTPPLANDDEVYGLGRQVWIGMNYAF